MKPKLTPLLIVVLYALTGGLWILFSDSALTMMVRDPEVFTKVSIIKGWVYVAVTAGLLYWLVRRYALEQKKEETARENIFDRILDGFVALDAGWRYTYVNRKAAEMFGRKPEDLVGKHIWTEFPEGIDQPFYKAYYRAAETQQFTQVEEYYPPYDRWFENRIYPSLEGISIFFTDITERKKTHLALQESERYNRLLFERSIIGLVLCRMDGSLLDVNEAFAKIIGRSVEETLGRNYWDITPNSYAGQEQQQLASLRTTGRYGPYEKEYVHKDGHLVPVRLQGRLIERSGEQCIWSSVEDITERKKAEAQLRRANRTLAAISGCNELVAHAEDEQLLLDAVCRRIITAEGYHFAWIGSAEQDEQMTVRPVAQAGFDEGYLETVNISWADAERGRGPTGTAIRTGKAVICRHIMTDPQFEPWRADAVRRGYASSIALPLILNNRSVGALSIYADEPDAFDEEETPMLSGMTETIAFGIGSLRTRVERNKASEVLLASEKRLRSIIEQSPIGIAFSRDGMTLDANKVYVSMFGYDDIGELRGKPLLDQIAPQCRPDIVERIRQRAQGQPIETSYETIGLRNDGSQFPFYVSVNRIVLSDGPVTISFFIDITERKRTEEELLISNEELQAINRIITTTTTTTTTTTGVKEILEKVLDEALNITGLEGGTICLVTPEETLHIVAHRETSEATIQDLTTHEIRIGECLCGECARDHRPLILWNKEAVLRYSTREAQRGEDIRFHAAYPLVIGGKCLGVLCVFTRTDNKPSERSLKLLETATSQIAIAVQNAQLFEEVRKYSETLENQVKERTLALQDSQRALIGLVEGLNEKSEELRAANERLKDVDRLKSMFIATMSHELRTPLNAVIGFSSILLKQWKGPLNDDQQLMLSTVLRSGKHLLALINDVIDVSKVEAGEIDVQREDFDLFDLIAEAAELIRKEVDDKGLALQVGSIHLNMKADRRRLLQCVLNLLSNAVKFTPQGRVRIAAGIEPGGGKPETVEIVIEDTGIGIKPEDMPKLFQAFSRLDSPLRSTVPGTGLGLYLTRKIAIGVFQGALSAASEPGKGSRFTLKIPVGEDRS